jgi:hypothetical protein
VARFLPGILVRHVKALKARPRLEFFGEGPTLFLLQVSNNDERALFGQLPGDGRSDARRAPSHERNSTLESFRIFQC